MDVEMYMASKSRWYLEFFGLVLKESKENMNREGSREKIYYEKINSRLVVQRLSPVEPETFSLYIKGCCISDCDPRGYERILGRQARCNRPPSALEVQLPTSALVGMYVASTFARRNPSVEDVKWSVTEET